MNVRDLSLSGVKLIEPKVFRDDRGFFVERFQEARFHELKNTHGIASYFVQDNHSRSKPAVIRGLHYQSNPAQAKLVGVIRGRIWDVVVDLRKHSPTFGKWEGVELSDTNATMLWVPAGFAHGFCVLGDEDADVYYKTDGLYSPSTEGGICASDPALGIQWPVKEPTLSVKDQALPTFAEYAKNPVFL